MIIRILTFYALVVASGVSHSVAYNLPGDSLSAGQQYVASSFSVKDWYSSGSFVGNAQREAIDDTARGFSRAHHKGYAFSSDLTYLLGVTDTLTLGMRFGYEFDKDSTKIDATIGDQVESELVSEGGTDLTVLAKLKRHAHSTWDLAVTLPICSAESVQDVCTSRPAIPKTVDQSGEAGGQGKGYYGIKLGMSSNWIGLNDQHWVAGASIAGALADEVYGNKVSAPVTFAAQFGLYNTLMARHHWSLMVDVRKMLEYTAYSEALQTEVDFGEQSHLGLTAQYHWQPFNGVQIKPFAELATRELASEKFVSNDLERHIEYTTGTLFVLGAQLSASF